MRFLDALTHVTPDGSWFGTAKDASFDRLLRELDEADIERAVLVALAGHVPNEVVLAAAARRPDRLVPALSLNPADQPDPAGAVTRARAVLRDAGARIVKFHPRLGHYDPLDERFVAVLEDMCAWPAPPLIWLCSLFRHARGPLRKPPVDAAHELVTRFPALTFVLLHGAGPEVLALAEAVRPCENAFVDLSLTLTRYAGTSVDADLRFLFTRFDRRTLFGSDWPEAPLVEARRRFENLAAASGANADAIARIAGGNLAGLLARVGL